MKKSAALLGAIVTVKVPYEGTADQVRGTITSITDKIEITELLDEADKNSGKVARVISVPAESVEALAFHKNPNVPEAEVEDGVLTVNGNVIRTGFYIKEVIATLPNRVYITVEDEDTGRVDVYSYNVAKDDTFYKVTSTPLALNLDDKQEMGTTILIPYVNKKTETEKVDALGEEEDSEYEVLEETGYLLISTESTFASVIKTELNSEIVDVKKLGEDGAYFTTVSNVRTSESRLASTYSDDDYEDNDDDDYDEEYDDDRGNSTSYTQAGRITPLEDDKVIIRAYKVVGRHLLAMGEVEMPGEYVSCVFAGKTVVIKTTKKIHVDNFGQCFDITDKYSLKMLDGYNYVVKTEVKNGTTALWFANESCNLKTYSEAPSDNGTGMIISVQ